MEVPILVAGWGRLGGREAEGDGARSSTEVHVASRFAVHAAGHARQEFGGRFSARLLLGLWEEGNGAEPPREAPDEAPGRPHSRAIRLSTR